MKLSIFKNPKFSEPEVILNYSEETEEVNKLIETLNSLNNTIQCFKNSSNFNIKLNDIYYFESVDERSYVYTKDNVYECKEKLYTIEEIFKNTSIVRVSKSCILNITKLKSVKPFINGKFEATMLSGEKIIINRHYVSAFKKKFNI